MTPGSPRTENPFSARLTQLWTNAQQPYDIASLAAFRILFGALAVSIPIRFLANGWVDRFYVAPRFYFPYWGFEFIRPLPAPYIHFVFGAMALMGGAVMLGLFYRVAIVSFFLLFTYVELIDVTTYLNHYYLVSLLAFVLCFLPVHRGYSIDARRAPRWARTTLPAWMTWLLRFQVGLVYVGAAHAKMTVDWLVYGQPVSLWLAARLDTPLLGPLFSLPHAGLVMSWCGFLYDLTIPAWLSFRKTRPFAYALVLLFHGMTHLLFDIGLFPLIMSLAAVVFFEPSWPRRVLKWIAPMDTCSNQDPEPVAPFDRRARVLSIVILVWCLVHVVMPLRAYAYGGNVLWHEQGMRWAWRVLCREKTASVVFRVRAEGWPHERLIPPRRFLTTDQEYEFAGQPDMILRLAHHIRDEYARRGERNVEVRVDALASLNGRRQAPLIDPEIDLAEVEDSLFPASWIMPAPDGPPI